MLWNFVYVSTIRTIHIEITNSSTTDSAIMTIRRMCSRTNFRGAEKELQLALKEFDQQKISVNLLVNGIK